MPHRLTELHSIMPLANIPSVLRHGILSHEEAAKLPHDSVALAEIQERRDVKRVPGGLRLHQYANLYFCARNPMLFLRKNETGSLCVLRVDKHVLTLPEVVLTDRNASSDYVRFFKSPEGLRELDFNLIFSTYWTSEDPFDYLKRKSIKCAEVLVPHRVPADWIVGAYVFNAAVEAKLRQTGFDRPITSNRQLFFS
ncbi:DUF4433 domain-containing protein [Geoalkalibacter halelectricus]|uniref:DUF4433 domain-containing protein n=1 Tax=Geoalkalibacter halelectricus TaxID=2847045 RepID=A0ABY5ZNI1_9BACT|nr:DUF4433 domain-containing protein [Geoalkalibacter halelectricus]MDO3377542.1 DUF4433 domain-containing protein [Geoalkalibacter halelectricus]UWZ80700.1 DUF4433 domain-containing protein [Geoalkalibacter halelectricus]